MRWGPWETPTSFGKSLTSDKSKHEFKTRYGNVRDTDLRVDLVLEYPFSRSTGKVIGAFMTGLR